MMMMKMKRRTVCQHSGSVTPPSDPSPPSRRPPAALSTSRTSSESGSWTGDGNDEGFLEMWNWLGILGNQSLNWGSIRLDTASCKQLRPDVTCWVFMQVNQDLRWNSVTVLETTSVVVTVITYRQTGPLIPTGQNYNLHMYFKGAIWDFFSWFRGANMFLRVFIRTTRAEHETESCCITRTSGFTSSNSQVCLFGSFWFCYRYFVGWFRLLCLLLSSPICLSFISASRWCNKNDD